MSTGTWDDPFVVDFAAAAGTATVDMSAATSTDQHCYVRIVNAPENRVYSLVVTDGTGSFAADTFDGWYQVVESYGEANRVTLGSYDRFFEPRRKFFGIPGGSLLLFHMNSFGTVDLSWTSEDWAPRPYTWFNPAPIDPAHGSVTYDAIHNTDQKFGGRRNYTFSPTTTDLVTITTDEPNSYWEVYREDGVYPYDDYVIDSGTGYFTPEVGQVYHLVVYPNASPDETTTYTVTTSATAVPPPPYVVANDLYANFTDLGAVSDGSFHSYDNTGATEDPELSWATRSIWYRFIVDADVMARIKLTPGENTPAKVPSCQVITAAGVNVGTGSGDGNNAALVNLKPGVEYRMAIYFDGANALSDWDAAGSMSFQLTPTPPALASYLDPTLAPYTLEPGNADPGGGQNYRIGPVFPGAGDWSAGIVRIVAPRDGGLSLILEAGSEGGTAYRPDAIVKLPGYETLLYGRSGYVPVSLSTVPTGFISPAPTDPRYWQDPADPKRMPSRPVGNTAIEPITFTVKAGDVIDVQISYAISGCYIRWGMTSTTKPPTDWISARFGDSITHDGTENPYGWTQEQVDAVRAGVADWPAVYDIGMGSRPSDQHMNPEDADGYIFPVNGERRSNPTGERYSAWTFSNWEFYRVDFQSDRIEIDLLEGSSFLDTEVNGALIAGGSGNVFRQVGGEDKATWSQFSGRVMHDPADSHTLLDMSTNLHLSRQQAYVRQDNRYQYRANDGTDNWLPFTSSATVRANELLSNLRPIQTRGEQGALDSYRQWGTPGFNRLDTQGTVIRHLTWQVQWNTPAGVVIGEPKEVYNTYRWVDSLHAVRSARRPYDTDSYPFPLLELNPDYPASSIWPFREKDTVVELYAVPVEDTDNYWVNPGMVRGGELVESWTFPNESTLDANGQLTGDLITVSEGPAKHQDITVLGSPLGFTDSLWKTDVLNGRPPELGYKFYDDAYASMTAPYRDGYFPWTMSIHALWDRWGYENQAPMGGQFAQGSFFYDFEASVYPRTAVGRSYPAQFRVALWEPSLAPLAPPPPSILPVAINESTATGNTSEYVYEGDVGVGTTTPILWFLYKKWGFLGDHIVAYGQGLGNTEDELHGVLSMGPGTAYPLLADITPHVTDWRLNAASNHAYDGTGVIFEGTSVAPPRVDAEVQTVEFVIPIGLTLTDPTEMHVYVTNEHGRSNALPLMLYPKVDIDMQATDPLLVTTASAMGSFDPTTTVVGATLSSDDKLPQRYSLLPTPFALTGPIPERAPQLLTNAAGSFVFTGAIQTTGLDDPVAITVPLTQRYRPIDSQVVPRSDIGTGVSLWMPNGTNANAWKFYVGSSPYVDPTTSIPSRNGEITRPAMVFPGDAYAELVNGLHIGPNFSIAMVTTIYPDPQPRSFLLSSFIQGLPDPDTYPLEVFIEGDVVTVQVGGRLFSTRIASGYIGRRPVILLLSISQWYVRFGLVSASAYVRDGSHALQKTSGLKLYLGRSNDAGTLRIATMDVLDLAINNTALSVSDFTLTLNRFDSAYGVMK